MQPNFEQLIQVIRTLAESTPYEFLRIVVASSEGEVRFIEVRDVLASSSLYRRD